MVFSNPPIIEGGSPSDGDSPVWSAATGTWHAGSPSPGPTLLSLNYAGSDPFDVVAWGLPDDWGGGIASLGVQLIVGTGSGITSGVLLDAVGDPIPDGWTFPAIVFVEGGTIYDIIAFNGFTIDEVQAVILVWGSEGGTPAPLPIPGGIRSYGPIIFDNLPTSDPANPGQLWNNNGIATVSAG